LRCHNHELATRPGLSRGDTVAPAQPNIIFHELLCIGIDKKRPPHLIDSLLRLGAARPLQRSCVRSMGNVSGALTVLLRNRRKRPRGWNRYAYVGATLAGHPSVALGVSPSAPYTLAGETVLAKASSLSSNSNPAVRGL